MSVTPLVKFFGFILSLIFLGLLFWLTHTMTGMFYFVAGLSVGTGIFLLDYQYGYVRSFLVLLILIPLSIFVASSTGNTIGQGLVAALLVGVLSEMLELWKDVNRFNLRFAPGARKPLTLKEIQWCVLVWAGVTLIVNSIIIVV